MIDAFRARKISSLLYLLGISNLSSFAVVKSLHMFGGYLVDNNSFFLLKASFKFFAFNFI